MKIVIQFKTENASFENPSQKGDCIRYAVARIIGGNRDGVVKDYDGNTVGTFKVTGK